MLINYKSVNILYITFIISFRFVVSARNTSNFAVAKSFTKKVARQGLVTEQHQVVTEDGYILHVFRVQRKSCMDKMRHPPVILQHGLLFSSDSWFDAGPKAGLGYLIANSCFDLWVPNTRGNYYSRGHISLDAETDAEYWDWSYDQIGRYDVSAVMDYVLKVTDSSKLNSVGFSQGAGCTFIMCAERPEYCDKIGVNIALSPAVRFIHLSSVLLLFVFNVLSLVQHFLSAIGIYEFLSNKETAEALINLACPVRHQTRNCTKLLALLDSNHEGSISYETHQEMFHHLPAGTSIKNMIQYHQGTKKELNVKFNYGRQKNIELYGKESPPAYNLSYVTAPVVLIQGRADRIIDIRDTTWAKERLPNVLEFKIIEDPMWNHIDMVFSRFIPQMVYPTIKQYLLKFSSI